MKSKYVTYINIIFFFNYFQIGTKDSDSNSLKEVFQKKVNSSRIDGKVRLTSDGTDFFRGIKDNKDKVKEFFDKLELELANAVPISPERITTKQRFQIDTSVNPNRIILSVNIKKDVTGLERSVNEVVGDLDALIRNKSVTAILFGEYSNYLDETYGYQRIRKNSFLKNCQMRIYLGERSQIN